MDLQPGMDSPRLSLSLEKGALAVPSARPQALFFFKVACPTCPLAAPAVERLRRAYPGLEVVAVSQDDLTSTRAWLDQHGLTAPVSLEGESYPASHAFGLATVPTLVLLDRTGKIASVQEGWSRTGYDELAREAARLVGASPVAIAPAEGPAFRPG